MNTQELYKEAHRLFSYDAETGFLIRKIDALNKWGKPLYNAKAGDVVTGKDRNGYLRATILGRRYVAHRIIWLMQTGFLPKKCIDHINGDTSDNRLVNLREATNSENGCNRGKQVNNTSGYKGVSPTGYKNNKYKSQIMRLGKAVYLGSFQTAELAYQAYCNKVNEIHGEFGRTA